MGLHFADQYSLLHYAVGVVAYFWNIPFILTIIIHTIFEIVENTKFGMGIINRFFVKNRHFSWPGGKQAPDSFINNVGDTIFFAAGWLSAHYLDSIGNKYGWYPAHIKN
ncbi:hypothetical protein KA005_11750 [bacterium]|nr:hypothetical protein [bacterium]